MNGATSRYKQSWYSIVFVLSLFRHFPTYILVALPLIQVMVLIRYALTLLSHDFLGMIGLCLLILASVMRALASMGFHRLILHAVFWEVYKSEAGKFIVWFLMCVR